MHNNPCVLTIAGSDSCGGAGIQADLKTFGIFETEGSTVLTAITAQNTLGVSRVEAMSIDMVRAQLESVFADLPIQAAKTGMLANVAIVNAVAEALEGQRGTSLVIDPVMVATSGARLLDRDAENALIEHLLPMATLVTPNLPEAAVLTGLPEDTPPAQLAERILRLGCPSVLIKGGHADGASVEDLLVTASGQSTFRHPRVDRRVHGTGCALSAAITAGLAHGRDLETAVESAIEWLRGMIATTWQPLKGELAMLPFGKSR